MESHEVYIFKEEKEEMLNCIKKINEILKRYPWFVEGYMYEVNTMNRVKHACHDAEEWIKCLDTREEVK